MDKSFNDDELSDIMKEIEALEEEFNGNDESEKIVASSVLEELAEMHDDAAIPVTNMKDSVLPFEAKAAPVAAKKTPHSSMMFKVQGEMNVELQFEVGGKTIMLEVSETGLTIQMEGGVTFSVPVSDAQSMKKAV